MYIFKNAFISVMRNKTRNLLIGVIIVVISCSSAITLAIKNSASTIIESYEQQYDITATIQVDRGSLMKNFTPGSTSKEETMSNFQNMQQVTVSDIEKYGESQYVQNYYYTNSINLNSTTAEKVESGTTNNMPENMVQNRKGSDKEMNSADFTLTGYSSQKAMTEFINGSYQITSGEVFSDFDSNSCIINEELATMNDLKVGDTITLNDPNDETKTYDVSITGIYTEKESDNSDTKMDMFSRSANTIITTSNMVSKVVTENESITENVNPTFILTSKDVIESFQNELKEKGMNEYFTLSTNLEQVENATKSVTSISTFATTFLIITLVIGGVVLVVINMINIRERKYEIGVLRTMGMKKTKLTMQIAIELLTVALIALLIGTALGACLSVPTANMLLENEISSSQEQMEDVNQNFGGSFGKAPGNDKGINNIQKLSGTLQIEQVSNINAVVDLKVLLEILLIAAILTFVSSISSMICIERFSPLAILRERT